jgi:hypothetical protein
MTGEAIIAELKDLQSIEGADRIVSSTIFGETVIVSKEHKAGELGILFDCETELSHEFCRENNLYRHSELNSDKEKKGYIEDSRRIRPIRLKGVKCSGLWMPISSLEYTHKDGQLPDKSNIGQQFMKWGSYEICKKYVVVSKSSGLGNKQGKAKENLVPTFKEHVDTDQFMRNLQHVKPGSILIVTEKLHGTSCRVGNLPVIYETDSLLKKFSSWLLSKVLFKTDNENKHMVYKHVVGSRRVTKTIGNAAKEGESYYEHDIWTTTGELFRGKLEKGETVYYEIVGYLPDGKLIMPSQGNRKLKSFMDKDVYKDFVESYGDTTSFTYGCQPKECKVFVYRMTMTNMDGVSMDLSWDQVKMRCEQMGVQHVPELKRVKAKAMSEAEETLHFHVQQEAISNRVVSMGEDPSTVFPMHLREGVCIRIDGESLTPKFLKQKGYLFKVLEGIIKDSGTVDTEEAES